MNGPGSANRSTSPPLPTTNPPPLPQRKRSATFDLHKKNLAQIFKNQPPEAKPMSSPLGAKELKIVPPKLPPRRRVELSPKATTPPPPPPRRGSISPRILEDSTDKPQKRIPSPLRVSATSLLTSSIPEEREDVVDAVQNEVETVENLRRINAAVREKLREEEHKNKSLEEKLKRLLNVSDGTASNSKMVNALNLSLKKALIEKDEANQKARVLEERLRAIKASGEFRSSPGAKVEEEKWRKASNRRRKDSRLKFPKIEPKKEEEKAQPFAGLVYQWNVVQTQIDAGIRITKRAKKFMQRMAMLHKKFASEIEAGANEEKVKVLAMKPTDRMNSCRDAFLMILEQSTIMAAQHLQFADAIGSVVLTPLSKFYEVGGSIAESTQHVKEDHAKSLSQSYTALRKSEHSTQHMIDQLMRQAEKVQKLQNNRTSIFTKRPKKEDVLRLQMKTIQAMKLHKDLCDKTAKHQETYLAVELPEVLTQMQVIEEMRIESFKKQILAYSQIIEQFSDGFTTIAEDVNFFGNAIKNHEDIMNFAVNCAFDKHLQLPEIRYKLTKTPEELTGDILVQTEDVFGASVDAIMEKQKKTHPGLPVPRILVSLSEAIEELGGFKTEGIFRVPAATTELNRLKELIQRPEYKIPPNTSPHVPAGLLKDFLRKLREPLVPTELYEKCLAVGKKDEGEEKVLHDILSRLPKVNQAIVRHLVELASIISAPKNVEINKMTMSNLAMVFSPSVLRNPSTDPLQMIANIKHEVRFVDLLMQSIKKKLPEQAKRRLSITMAMAQNTAEKL
ncbi:hypothetical protein AAMO2058_000908300 [Amorphochlora amoebiformis]